MEIPFYRSSDWRRRSSPHFSRSTPRTVVSIPVEFIGPEPAAKSESDYAVVIQKIWKGFRVRNSVKKISDVRRQVEEAEKTILEASAVEAIRRDERERLKLSERLMALLFRLDSIRGFDVAVKELRKSVISRAILLQEKVDSIGAVQSAEEERELGVVKEEKSSGQVTLEKLMEENNRLMKLMTDMYEKSEMQSQILSSLSKRVGQLENAFASDKLRRRNKKTRNSGRDVTEDHI